MLSSSIPRVWISKTYHNPNLNSGEISSADVLVQQFEEKMVSMGLSTERALRSLAQQMIYNDCSLGRQSISNLIILGYTDPQSYALSLYKSIGYTGVRSGDVIYVAN